MKKSSKIIFGIIIVFILLWGITFFIDYNKVSNFKEPIIAIKKYDDGNNIEYVGLGYTVKCQKYNSEEFGTQLGKIDMYFFNKFIVGAIADMDIKEKEMQTEGMKIILSLEDNIANNSAWCGTFNLIWNDLKNDLAKQDIIFTPQLEVVENLNKGTFNTSELSENSYYKVYGIPTPELKQQIEKAISDKFNETSDILDDFDWKNGGEKDYFLYAMLKKEFEFPKVFTELEEGKFGNYENVKYFGINEKTDEQVRNQVRVLYYNSKDDFAIKLITNGDDEVILAKGTTGNTFGNIYEEIKEKNGKYTDSSSLNNNDSVKIPNIKFNLKEEFPEIQNKEFLFSNGDEYYIEKAMQTIQFELDKKGGKIKSEAGIMTRNLSVSLENTPRELLIDDTFVIFLQEKGKDLPYFGAKISDISSVQSEISK